MSLREGVIEALQAQGMLTPAQARSLRAPGAHKPRPLSTQLIELGRDSVTVLKVLCAESGLPLAPPARLRAARLRPLPSGVPWLEALAAPFGEDGGALLVAVADPDLLGAAREAMPEHRLHLALEREVRRLLQGHGQSTEGIAEDDLVSLLSEEADGLSDEDEEEATAPVDVSPDAMALVWQRVSDDLPESFFRSDEGSGDGADPFAPQSTLPWVVAPAESLVSAPPAGDDEKLERFERSGTVLGRGGMATVERAVDAKTGRDVALKILHPHLLHNEEELERFRREVETLERLKHGNIVRALARSLTPPDVFVACELVEGKTAKHLIAACRQVPVVAAARLMLEVLQGLAHAHDRGVVHRDIKPENLLIAEDGPVKLCDFGVACAPGERPTDGLVGTPAYMSPEQVRGKAVDVRSDLFSAGTVFYELITGENPFVGDNPSVTIQRICEEDPPHLFEVDPTVPSEVERVVTRLLERDPARRYARAEDAVKDLERFLRPLADRYEMLLPRCLSEPEVTAVLLKSDQAEAELQRARSLQNGRRSEACQAALAAYRAAQLDPSSEEAGTLLHDLATREGFRFTPSGDQRIVSMRMALRDEPNNTDLLLRLSDAYRKDGDLVQAAIQLKKLLHLRPDDVRAQTQLAYLCGTDDRWPFGTAVAEARR